MEIQGPLYLHGPSFRWQGQIMGTKKGPKAASIRIVLYYRVKYLVCRSIHNSSPTFHRTVLLTGACARRAWPSAPHRRGAC